jgi:Flp pilus assembly protein TadD
MKRQVYGWMLLGLLAGCASTPQRQAKELNQQGIEHLMRREYAQAEIHFSQAAQLTPQDPDVVYHLATAAHHAGDTGKAEASYRACLKLDPYHAKCRHGLAVLLIQQDKAKEAWQMTEEWLTQWPNSADAQAEHGWLLRTSGDFPTAQAQLQKALQTEPNNVRALVELGLLYETYQYPDRARALYERALLHDPYQMEAQTRLTSLSKQRKSSQDNKANR